MSENTQSSRKIIFIAVSAVAVLAIIAVVAVIFVLPAFFGGLPSAGSGGFVRLTAENPTILHQDGVLVAFRGGEPLSVRLGSEPREMFMSGQSGAEWADALAQLPPELIVLSPVYTIETREDPAGRLFAEVSIPNGAEPLETLSLYGWDEQAFAWRFIASQQDVERDVVGFTPTSTVTHVIAAQRSMIQPQVGLVLRDGTTIDEGLAADVNVVLPTGAVLLDDGRVGGSPVVNNAASMALSTPLVFNADSAAGAGFQSFDDAARNLAAYAGLSNLAVNHSGVALDFAVEAEQRNEFSVFVTGLSEQMHAQGKTLSVVIHGTTLTAYDLVALGQAADQVWWVPGDDPTLYLSSGTVQSVLYTLVGSIDRGRLGLLVSANGVEIAPPLVAAVTTNQAIDRFGEVSTLEGYLAEGNITVPGEEIPFRLSGALQALAYDANLGANYLAYTASDGTVRHVYLASAESLTRKLHWANVYGLKAIAVQSASDELADAAINGGLASFIASVPAPAPAALSIVWQVTGPDGEQVSETSGDLSAIQFVWETVPEPGDYVISAEVRGQASGTLGDLSISIVEPKPTVVATGPDAATSEDGDDTSPGVQAGAAAVGGFELGGQARDTGYAGQMYSAGMSWIKYQVRSVGDVSGAAGAIAQGHAAGFKVLITIIDPGWNHSDYGAFASFMGEVAAQGPDAIEVWNEMNLEREWPAERMSGANYVNDMLAPSYNAIKAVNPNIIVISGALAPTGAFGGCPAPGPVGGEMGCNDDEFLRQMAAAGGANYMDCVGTHFNAGATSPYANSGHPGGGHYSWYMQPMMNLYGGTLGKPVCFTELGFVIGGNLAGGPFGWANSTTVEQHAQWLAEAATISAQSGTVRLMIVWNVAGYSTAPGDPQGEYSIVRPGGGCPACTTLGQVMGVQ